MKKVIIILMLTVSNLSANIVNDLCAKNGVLEKKHFSKNLLSKVDFEQELKEPIKSLFKSLGKCSQITNKNGSMTFEFENHYLNGTYVLDKNQFVSIWFSQPKIKNKDLKKLFKRLSNGGNIVSYFLIDENKVYKKNENIPLYIASSIKLKVLEEFELCTSMSKCSKQDILILKEDFKTSPSGILHQWPNDSKILVSTALNLMISKSDNTATDLIIHYLKQKKMNSFTTMQQKFISLFSPKSKKFGPDDFKKINLTAYPKTGGTLSTTKDLCETILKLKDAESLSINQDGLRGEFKKVLYKGGSRFGVFQKTYAWKTEQNIWKCLSITINNPIGVNEEAVSETIRNIIL